MATGSGARLGPYVLGPVIGSGGMGEVYRAHDSRLGRDVAIKILPPDVADDPDRLRRFESEARAAAALNHHNILVVHDVGREHDTSYLVTELLEGRTLRAVIDGGAVPLPRALDYAVQIAEGLAAAHARGIVHRDLKPENVFVTTDGRVKILDFGLAKTVLVADAATTLGTPAHATAPHVVLGTPGYMAPEQVRGEPVDHRADIFAFGCVLYELLGGRPAFGGSTTLEVLSAILRDTPAPLAAVSPPLTRVVERCLEKDPATRFQSARDLAFALRGLTHSTRGPGRRVAVVMLAAAVLATGAFLWWRPGEPTAIRSLAVLPLRNVSGDPSQDWFAEGMTEALSSTLSQIGALTVVSSTSTTRYKNHAKSVTEIAKELGNVDVLLEGSISRSDRQVRVIIAAIDARIDRRVWTRTYEHEFADVFALYSKIALTAAREMSLAVTPLEQARLASTRIVRPEAYEAYLRGSYLMTRWHEGGCHEAKRHFRRAIDLDPGFTPPYGTLAFCLYWPVQAHRAESDRAEVKAAATLALEKDPTLAMGHVAAAFVKMRFDYDWVAAEALYKQALERDPGSAPAHVYHAELLDVVGREEEAIAAMRHGLRLSPFWIDHNVAFGYLLVRLGHYDAGIGQIRKTLELDTNYVTAWFWLAEAHAYKGDQRAAVEAELEYLTRVLLPSRVAELRTMLESAYARSGWSGFWRSELALAEEEFRRPGTVWKESFARHSSHYWMARRYARLGERARALAALEQAYEQRDVQMPFIQREALFEPLRQERRYQDIIRRMGLPRGR